MCQFNLLQKFNLFLQNDSQTSSEGVRFFSKNPRQRQFSFPPPTLNTQLPFKLEEEDDDTSDDTESEKKSEDEESEKAVDKSNQSSDSNSFEIIR